MKRFFYILAAILLVSSFLLIACSPSTSTPTASTSTPQTGTTSTPGATTTGPTTTTTAPITAPATYAPGTYKFKYNNFFPPTSLYSILAEMWIKEINKRTNGAVEIAYLPGASLTTSDKVYDGVVTGISDIGFSVVAYNVGRFPVTELIDMPQGYPSGYISTMVANDYYNKFKPAEFNDVHVLYFQATGPQVIFTTKTAVSKLEDLKGLVLRSTGVGAKIATVLGAQGYAAAQNQGYELMSKGVVQGSIAPREVLLGWKQGDVVNYVTECFDIGSVSNMYVVMNKEKWGALPADIQKVFTDVSLEWIKNHGMVSATYDKIGMDYFLAQPNRKEIFLSADESKRWIEKVQPLLNNTLLNIAAKGFNQNELQQYIQDRIKYWAANSPKDADMAAWVTANVKKP
jgi:TRAP-type C4-dicarboxylate transport system substrate-binding protein